MIPIWGILGLFRGSDRESFWRLSTRSRAVLEFSQKLRMGIIFWKIFKKWTCNGGRDHFDQNGPFLGLNRIPDCQILGGFWGFFGARENQKCLTRPVVSEKVDPIGHLATKFGGPFSTNDKKVDFGRAIGAENFHVLPAPKFSFFAILAIRSPLFLIAAAPFRHHLSARLFFLVFRLSFSPFFVPPFPLSIRYFFSFSLFFFFFSLLFFSLIL